MDSPDVVQNAKDSSDWRHLVSNLMQDEDNGDGAGDTASEAFICGICSKSNKLEKCSVCEKTVRDTHLKRHETCRKKYTKSIQKH